MQLVVQTNGTLHCLYDEAIDLTAFGPLSIARASHVEPDDQGAGLPIWPLCPVRSSGRLPAAAKPWGRNRHG